MKNADPYDTLNISVVTYLSGSANARAKVLDVGCWHGALGKELQKTTSYVFDGVDNNTDALLKAKSNGYSEVFNVDLNSMDGFEKVSGKYDYIVFGDVLEHTVNPDAVLSKFMEKLDVEGRIIVSLPNIGFLLYRVTHLFGQWNYKDSGVMDKTHLRFFTPSTMRNMFSYHGLEIVESKGFIGLSNRSAVVRVPLRWLANMFPSMFAVQLIFMLRASRELKNSIR